MSELSEDFIRWWATLPMDVQVHHHNLYMLNDAFEAGRAVAPSPAVAKKDREIPGHLIELARSDWGQRLAANTTHNLFLNVLEAARKRKPVVICRTDELYGSDRPMYAIKVEDDPEFWLDAFDMLHDAIELCEEMGWPISKLINQ